jgi:hypothetical protein
VPDQSATKMNRFLATASICILDARHPANAIIGSTSNILIELESPFNRKFPPRDAFYHTRRALLPRSPAPDAPDPARRSENAPELARKFLAGIAVQRWHWRPFRFFGRLCQLEGMKPRHAAAPVLVGWYLNGGRGGGYCPSALADYRYPLSPQTGREAASGENRLSTIDNIANR